MYSAPPPALFLLPLSAISCSRFFTIRLFMALEPGAVRGLCHLGSKLLEKAGAHFLLCLPLLAYAFCHIRLTKTSSAFFVFVRASLKLYPEVHNGSIRLLLYFRANLTGQSILQPRRTHTWPLSGRTNKLQCSDRIARNHLTRRSLQCPWRRA